MVENLISALIRVLLDHNLGTNFFEVSAVLDVRP